MMPYQPRAVTEVKGGAVFWQYLRRRTRDPKGGPTAKTARWLACKWVQEYKNGDDGLF